MNQSIHGIDAIQWLAGAASDSESRVNPVEEGFAYTAKRAHNPIEVEDAALIDGCSRFDIYWRIVLPMIKPALATLGVITFILWWNSFLWPFV